MEKLAVGGADIKSLSPIVPPDSVNALLFSPSKFKTKVVVLFLLQALRYCISLDVMQKWILLETG